MRQKICLSVPAATAQNLFADACSTANASIVASIYRLLADADALPTKRSDCSALQLPSSSMISAELLEVPRYAPTPVIRSLTSHSRRATFRSYDSLLEVFSLQLA
jgi:hypothetical protein